jgi:hypothetical protein
LTNVNLSFFDDPPKTAPPPEDPWAFAVVVVVVFELLPQACRMAAARPAAPPVSAARRLKARSRDCGVGSSRSSAHSRRSRASWTGSRSDTELLLRFRGPTGLGGVHGCRRRRRGRRFRPPASAMNPWRAGGVNTAFCY